MPEETHVEFYVLHRSDEYTIVSVTPGDDALHGRGSWDMVSGPHASWSDAWDAMVEYHKGR
jgi:hypothetical protein